MDNSTEDLITTTTTDWDSGDSEGIDYVYEEQKSSATITTTSTSTSTSTSTRTEKQSPKSKSPGRKKSPKAKTHCHKCVCGHAATSPTEPPAEPADQTSVHPLAEDDAEETIFEEDTESETAGSRSRPPRHQIRPPSYGPEGSRACQHKPGHKDKGDKGDKGDKKKGTATKVHRKRSPYIEEYPEGPNRPAILLKEHQVPRRFSGSDTKHIFDWQRSTSGSRGRSPTGKRQPPPPKIIKSSPKRSAHRRRRVESSEDRGDKLFPSDMNNAHPDIDEPTPVRHYRHSNHGMGMDVPTTIARASVWSEHHAEPTYASSWPLKSGTHLSSAQPRQHDMQYDSDDEIDEQPYKDDNGFDEHHGRRWTAAREMQVSKENETGRVREVSREVPREIGSHRETGRQREVVRGRERVAERRHTERHQPSPSPPPQDQYEPRRAPSLRRRRTVAGHTIGTIDQGRHSAATELCEIWRGRASDWESPYPSDGETWSDNDDDGIPPRMLLEGVPPPPREPTPTMLPPHGLRSHFGFAPRVRPLPITVRVPSPVPCPWPQRSRTWAGENNMTNGFFLLEAPLTTEPMAMMGDAEKEMGCSGAPSQVPRGGWTYPLVRYHPKHHYAPPPPPPPPPRRSRSPSPPIFSARKTKEFLSPVPTRVDRFDFDAWGRERASKSSLALAPMALVY